MTEIPGDLPRIEAAVGGAELFFETLQSELSGSRDTIATLLKSADQVLAIGATILASVVILTFREGIDKAIPALRVGAIVAPFVFVILAAYWLRVRTAVNALGGYKAALEECLLNASHQPEARLWESGGAANLKDRFGYQFNMFINVIVYLFSIIVGCFFAVELAWKLHPYWVVAYYATVIGLTIALGFTTVDSTRAFEETRVRSLALLPNRIPEDAKPCESIEEPEQQGPPMVG